MVVQRMLAVTLVIAAACGAYSAQPSGPGAESAVERPAMKQLTIVLGSSRHIMDTGYGVVYRGPVEKVIEGELADREISLHVFPNSSGKLYAGHFRGFEDAAPATLRFTRVEGSDFYEGFHASDGTSWKLVSVDAK